MYLERVHADEPIGGGGDARNQRHSAVVSVHEELGLAATSAVADGRQEELVKDGGLSGLGQQVTPPSLHELFEGLRGLLAHLKEVVGGIVCSTWRRKEGRKMRVGERLPVEYFKD